MAYEPTSWKTGDIVTSAKLNKMENGIAGAGPLIVNADENGTLDKTWQEIYDAMASGRLVIISLVIISREADGGGNGLIFEIVQKCSLNVTPDGNLYQVYVLSTGFTFSTISPDEYPVLQPTNNSNG